MAFRRALFPLKSSFISLANSSLSTMMTPSSSSCFTNSDLIFEKKLTVSWPCPPFRIFVPVYTPALQDTRKNSCTDPSSVFTSQIRPVTLSRTIAQSVAESERSFPLAYSFVYERGLVVLAVVILAGSGVGDFGGVVVAFGLSGAGQCACEGCALSLPKGGAAQAQDDEG